MKYTRSDFPKGFLFGTAQPAPSLRGLDCHRFVIRWADTLPDGRTLDPEVLEGHAQQIDRLLELGLRPCLVLDHRVPPEALEDRGGWRNRDMARWFAEFAEHVVARFGDRLFSVSLSELSSDSDEPRTETRSLHHQLLARGCAIRMMRSYGMTNLGIELGNANPDMLEVQLSGRYPATMLDRLAAFLPESWQDDLEAIAKLIDWCGVSVHDLSGAKTLRDLQNHTKDLPLFVTLADEAIPDQNQALSIVHKALAEDIPVQAAFVQSEDVGLVESLHSLLSDGPQPAPWIQPRGNLHAHWNLVADIGGTNTRLGVVTNGELTDLRKYPTGTLTDLRAALHDLRDDVGTDPRAVVAAGAGPVQNGTIRLTNANLILSEDDLARATGARHTFVINDFTAAAWSVAEIGKADVEVLQGEASPPMGTRLVVGPGTGLGVGALLYSEGHFHTVSGEGGHMGLSPRHHDEVEVFDVARRIAPECFFDDSLVLEAEMFLSGTGLPILYQAIGMAGGQINTAARQAKDILQDALDGSDPYAVKTARMFTEHLGAIMGDLAVALVPTGGVFLVGGVAEKNRWLFGQDFLRAFNAGGRFDTLRRGMNLYVSEQDEFGIVGANNFCKNALAH